MIDIAALPTAPLTETPAPNYATAIAHLKMALPVIERVSDHMGCITKIIIEELEERIEEGTR